MLNFLTHTCWNLFHFPGLLLCHKYLFWNPILLYWSDSPVAHIATTYEYPFVPWQNTV